MDKLALHDYHMDNPVLRKTQIYLDTPRATKFSCHSDKTWYCGLFKAPLTTGHEEFCIGNPWGKGDSGVQNYAGRANWKGTVVTKDWFIGRSQHKTVNFGSNISRGF